MYTMIDVNGVCYNFSTSDGVTTLKVEAETTRSDDIVPKSIHMPDLWLVTRGNGTPLFGLRPDICDKPFRILTAEKLYAEKIQWFEPLADYYRELIWVNPESSVEGAEAYKAYKHHTWQSIIDFAVVDRHSIMYYRDMPGDWKKQKDGGSAFLLCLVEGEPYWTDGLGQIPYAVDTFRMYWEQTNDIDLSVRKTGGTGLQWADGTSGGEDKGSNNVYDNFIIIRASLWASKNFLREVVVKTFGGLRSAGGDVPEVQTIFKPVSITHLRTSITADELAKYKTWAS